MKKLSIKAEQEYEIRIDVKWRDEIALLMQGRNKVAFITSSSFSPDLGELLNFDSEVHQFAVPDGEAGKTFSTVKSIWDGCGCV